MSGEDSSYVFELVQSNSIRHKTARPIKWFADRLAMIHCRP
jgi:hypothetical protein